MGGIDSAETVQTQNCDKPVVLNWLEMVSYEQ